VLSITQAVTPEQIDQTRAMFLEYAQSLNFSLCFQSFDAELAGLPGDYAPPEGRLLLATFSGQPAGCVALHRFGEKSEHTCEMKRLYVRPEFRGHNIGRALIDAAISAARDIGYRSMLLDTVRGSHDKAIEIYREYGFREIAPYRENPQPGVLYMQLDLITESSQTPRFRQQQPSKT
jgi:putative acetyltransferase